MKAVVIPKPYEVIYENKEIPKPEHENVLVKILYGGICGSDLYSYEGKNPNIKYPQTPGHEAVGEIVGLGDGVKRRNIGEKVVIEPVWNECGKCYCCKSGFPHCCSKQRFLGANIEGCFQEYRVIPENKLYPINNDMPLVRAILAEPFGVGLEAVKIANKIRDIKGEKIGIIGAGPIGLATLIATKVRGGKVIIFDIRDSALKRAKKLAADKIVNIKREGFLKSINLFTNNKGINAFFECSGDMQNFYLMLESISDCGRIIIVGMSTQEVTYRPYIHIRKHIHILGTRKSNMIPDAIKLLNNVGDIIEKQFITNIFSFKEAKKAYETLRNNKIETCKVLLRF